TQTINNLNQTISEMKNKLSAHQDTISVLTQQKEDQIKLYKTREDKELEKVIELENKVKVLDNIVYKTGQSVQTMNMLNNKCRMSFVKPEYLKNAKQANPRLYDLEMKNKLSAHQDTISILKQQKDAQIKLYKSREDKEIEKVIDLENKVKVLDNIVYKTGQTVQTMNMLNKKCQTSFVKPEYLKKAKQANPRLYDTCCYNDNLALMLSPESDEVIRLEKESRSKLSDLIRHFDYAKLNSLYDLFVPQCEKSSEQRFFSERSRVSPITVQKEKKSFNKQPTLLEKQLDESIRLGKM
nr:hypothetical protein [Tanacetum cinerariifolium]